MKTIILFVTILYASISFGQNSQPDLCEILNELIKIEDVESAIFDKVDTTCINLCVVDSDSLSCKKSLNFSYKNKFGTVEICARKDLPPIYKSGNELLTGKCIDKHKVIVGVKRLEEGVYECQLIYRCNARMMFVVISSHDQVFQVESVSVGSL